MFDGRWRTAVDRTTGPVGETLHRHGITADVLTATGLVSAGVTACLVATGHLHLAVVMLIVTGLHDLLDGPVAKAAGTASVRGAFFDSVTDRVADAVLMLGCAWYLLDHGGGHVVLLPMGILAVTALISYERAKAESLGLSAKGGLMERGERMFLLGVGFLATAIFVPVLWILFVLVSFTALSRFVKVWNAASGRDAVIGADSRPGASAASIRAGRPAVASGAARASPGVTWTDPPGPPWGAGGRVGRRPWAAAPAGPGASAARPLGATRTARQHGRRRPSAGGPGGLSGPST